MRQVDYNPRTLEAVFSHVCVDRISRETPMDNLEDLMNVRGGLFVIVCLLISACAVKKDQPARGTVIGFAKLTGSVQETYSLNDVGNCFRIVGLTTGKNVLEISNDISCDTVLSASVIASLTIAGDLKKSPNSSLLLAGEAASDSDKTPTGELFNAGNPLAIRFNLPVYEIVHLCTYHKRMEYSLKCHVTTDKNNLITRLDYDQYATLAEVNRRMGMNNLDNADAIKAEIVLAKASIVQLNLDIDASKTALGTLGDSATSIRKRTARLQTKLTLLAAAIDTAEGKRADIAKLQTDVDALNASIIEVTKQANKDAITALKAQVDAINAGIDKASTVESKKAISDAAKSVSDLAEAVKNVTGEDASKGFGTFQTKVDGLKTELETLKKNFDTQTSDESKAKLKAISDAIEAILKKENVDAVEALKTKVGEITAGIESATKAETKVKVTEMATMVSTLTTALDKATNETAKEKVKTLQTDVNSLQTSFDQISSDDVKAKLKTISDSVKAVSLEFSEVELKDLQRQVSVSEATITKAQTDGDTTLEEKTKETVAQLKTEITAVEARINGLKGNK